MNSAAFLRDLRVKAVPVGQLFLWSPQNENGTEPEDPMPSPVIVTRKLRTAA